MTLRSRATAIAAFATGGLLAQRALGQPIAALVPSPLSAGSVALRQRGSVELATAGPAPEFAEETSLIATTMAAASVHARLTLAAQLDYVWRTAELSAPDGGRIHRTVSGWGDLNLVASSPVSIAEPLLMGPFLGIKLPTASDARSDAFGRLPQRLQVGTGAVDVPAGVLARWTRAGLDLYTVATYTLRTEANEFDAGDSFRWDLAAQRAFTPPGAALVLEPCLETHVTWRAADRGRRAPVESGGMSWFVAPGLRGRYHRHALEGAIEFPLTQPFDQHVDLVMYLGYRWMMH